MSSPEHSFLILVRIFKRTKNINKTAFNHLRDDVQPVPSLAYTSG